MLRPHHAVLAALCFLTSCIPYTVGTTAEPVRRGERTTTMSTFVMPSISVLDSTHSLSNLATDVESRWGIDQRSDIGLRIPAGGMILNYKRLLSAPASLTKVAVLPGVGFVNFGQHVYFELSLVASKHSANHVPSSRSDSTFRAQFVPYGGVRVMQVAPLAQRAVHDRPTAGGFVGVRIGSADFGLSHQVGVFYDHSALGVRKNDLVIVPAISVHGEMMQILRDIMRGAGPAFF